MTYALAHFTKLKPTINPVKCHYIKEEEITQVKSMKLDNL